MNAASPGVIAVFQPNPHYPSHAAHLEALAEAMRCEYKSNVDAGLILQIDCPDLAMGRHVACKHATEEQFLGHVHEQVEALNHALKGPSADRIERFASIVGRERVMAGSDGGFSTFAGDGLVGPQIVFAKLCAGANGARIASDRLWPQ